MNIENPKIYSAIFFDTRSMQKDETYPLKLRITHRRKQKYFRLKLSFTKEDYNKIMAPRPRGQHKEIKLILSEIEERAIEIINEMPVFSFKSFEDQFYNRPQKTNDAFKAGQKYSKLLFEEGRISSAESYALSMNSLKKFSKSEVLPFNEITIDFLKKYEKWMVGNGKSYTTVGIYLRNLRKLFNDAIAKGLIKQEFYPYGKNKYQIPSGRNIKKALDLSEIEKIFNYNAEKGSNEERSRDLWIFSYLSNGMNIADIAKLKYSNIEDDKITFYREKTRNTSKQNMKPIIVMLVPETIEIIKEWGNNPKSDDDYVFPILTSALSPERQRAIVKQATRTINKYMGKISEKLGINKNITTYFARHSFSTILKQSGASIEFISESLGHHDLKTTEHYLDSFEDKTKREFASKLTAFKKEN